MAENHDIIVTFTETRRNQMKPGEKYIIEIESVSKMPKGDIAFIKGFKTLVFDGYGLSQLRRAEEIGDAYRRGFTDGSGGVAKTRKELLEAAYQDGLDDAWCMIRTMYSKMTIGELRRIFNMPDVSSENIVMTILNAFPAAEVKKRLNAYEKEKEEKEKQEKEREETIVPGDEVKYRLSDRTFVVTQVDGEFISGFDKDGSQFCDKRSCNWEKTGRHFDLSKLFQFMGRKDDGPEL